jgi:membrane protein DedA with SNARE-associated domain
VQEIWVLNPATAIVLANSASPSVELGSGAHYFERLVAIAFDPSWNVDHRAAIFAVIVGVLFISGFGVPLPEDIPLTLAGFTTTVQANFELDAARLFTTFLIVLIPILLGDLIAYGLGRRFGLGLRERVGVLRRLLPPRRLSRVHAWFARYGAFAVFLGRQVTGLRFVAFFTAGAMRVPLPKFVAFDSLGCAVSVPIWLTLGALASRHGQAWLHGATGNVSRSILLVVVVVIAAFALVALVRNGREKAERNEAGGVQ